MSTLTLSRRRLLSSTAAAAAVTTAPGAAGCVRAAASSTATTKLRLHRGVNLHHLLNWPELASAPNAPVAYSTRPFTDPSHSFDAEEVRRIRAAGFDFVRLTLDPAIHLAAAPQARRALEEVVLDRVRALEKEDLAVIVDLHPVSQNPRYTPEKLVAEVAPEFSAYVELVGRLAGALAREGVSRTALEPFNEPPGVAPDMIPRWQTRLEMLHAAARRAAPDLPLVLNGAQWDSPAALQQLNTRPFRDGPVLFTFHYYGPHLFTHQGVQGDITRYVRDLTWPADEGAGQAVLDAALARLADDGLASPEAKTQSEAQLRRELGRYPDEAIATRIEQHFDAVASWAKRNGVSPEHILLGEFGAVKVAGAAPAQRRSRLAWLSAVRVAAEQRGFPWAYWALRGYGGMELIPKGGRELDKDTMAALGLPAGDRGA